uniref:hypothetical protein n=1 Tax=Salmonella enterica TaxID=28901 RepID=UPI00329A0457
YTIDPSCGDAASCQGERGDPACATFQCETNTVDDDTACDASTESKPCGCYPSVFCNGTEDQSAPECATTCAVEGDCDTGCTCDAGSV